MAKRRLKPGAVRDAIVSVLQVRAEASTADIIREVEAKLGRSVPASSVRSYLNLNVPGTFIRVKYGRYKLANP